MSDQQNSQRGPVILLVEDDSTDVQLVQAALKRTPGEITLVRVEDGDGAVNYLAGTGPYENRDEHPLPLTMFLDIKLPKRSGFEVLHWLRSQAGPIKRLPTVMLTASKHRQDVNRAFDQGANAYVAKPDSIKELSALLGEFKGFWLGRLEFPDIGFRAQGI